MNKLIAEFMGFTVLKDGYCDNQPNNRSCGGLPKLEFMYQSWNELMPVVMKIQSIDEGNFCVTIDQNVCKIWSEDNSYCNVETDFSTMEAVYKAVVNFINWYNELGEYDYSCTSENIYASFDYGTVLASNLEEATTKSKEKILYDLKKCNDALEHCDITFGFKVEMNLDELKVTKK